jgi:hypothetical protein
MRKSVCALELFAMRHGALLTFFVDELLALCSELTCLAVCLAACEVAMTTRRKRPVELGRVQPTVAPSVWWCRVSRGRAAAHSVAISESRALAAKLRRLPWASESRVSDGWI